MRALVTGGAGFIGSHLVDALVRRGDEVTVVDHLWTHAAETLAGHAHLIRADVTEVRDMVAACRDARPEVVYHLAAQIDVRHSVADPSTDAHVNIGGTAAMLEAARRAGARRVVLASTAGVYGDPRQVPTPEYAAIDPLSPYGASKAAAESYLRLFSRIHGLSTLALRMANVYGPRQNPGGESGVVAIFCGAAVGGTPATVFGDGRQTRDFVYVGDVVEAFLAAGRSDVEGALNVGTARETSLSALAGAIGVATRAGPVRLGEIERSCLDATAAAERLGWRARTALGAGLELTLDWLATAAAQRA